jgi:hypothetical protein
MLEVAARLLTGFAAAPAAEAVQSVLVLPAPLLLLPPLLLWMRLVAVCLLNLTKNPRLMCNGRPPVPGKLVLFLAPSGAKRLESIAVLFVPLLATAVLLVLAAGLVLALLHCLALLLPVLMLLVLSVGRTTALLP